MDWIGSPVQKLILPDLAGKTAVVTGASHGIGLAVAKALLDNKVRVFGLARSAGDLRRDGFVHCSCDLGDASEINGAFQKIENEAASLDFVVNVAGADPKYSIDTISVGDWDRLVDLNLRAYYFVIKNALPLLRLGAGKSIVNISSINYRLGVPGRAPYSATKAGIIGLTTGLSRELGRENIRINTISPGWTFTERQVREYFSGEEEAKHLEYLEHQQSIKLKITPEDIANHVLFYLSAVSRASTAHNCVVDGGWILE